MWGFHVKPEILLAISTAVQNVWKFRDCTSDKVEQLCIWKHSRFREMKHLLRAVSEQIEKWRNQIYKPIVYVKWLNIHRKRGSGRYSKRYGDSGREAAEIERVTGCYFSPEVAEPTSVNDSTINTEEIVEAEKKRGVLFLLQNQSFHWVISFQSNYELADRSNCRLYKTCGTVRK